MTVTFETKCWEKDWRSVLNPVHIESIVGRHTTEFVERRMLVNNVQDPGEAMKAAEDLVKRGLLTSAVFVPDYVEPALMAFGLTAEDLGKGYWYSTAEIVGIRLCTTKYLLHYASDTALAHRSDWADRGCAVLAARTDVTCVNPVWNGRLREAAIAALTEDASYYYGRGFSDQCYLVEAARWREADLTKIHPASERYPGYAVGLFEMRADSWMRHYGLLRAIDKTATYVHPALPGSI